MKAKKIKNEFHGLKVQIKQIFTIVLLTPIYPGRWGGMLRTHTFFDARLLNFSNRKGTPKLLDFSYFVIT